MRTAKRKHILLSGIILLIILGLLGSAFLFTKKTTPKQYAFAPTPTAVPTPSEYRKIPSPDEETVSWQTFTDNKLQYSIQYPDDIIIDERQTVRGRITVFIFEGDKTASLPGKVTALYLADTGKSGIDGFTAFSRGDCGKECKISYKNTDWVTINNVYGVRNPLPNDVHNYYLTDKKQSGSVLNAYVGGYLSEDKEVKRKIEIFEQMIKTIRFDR